MGVHLSSVLSISSELTVFSFTWWWLSQWINSWVTDIVTDWEGFNIVYLFWLRILLRFETCLDISGMCQTVANSLWAHACIRTTNTHTHTLLQTHTHNVSIHPLECVHLCSDRSYIHILTPCLSSSTTPPERGCHTWHMSSHDWDTFTGNGGSRALASFYLKETEDK